MLGDKDRSRRFVKTRVRLLILSYLWLFLSVLPTANPFSSTSTTTRHYRASRKTNTPSLLQLQAIKIDGYDEALRIIDDCATKGEPNDDLYNAIRFVEKKAYIIYPDLVHKQELWDKAHGSWKLELSTGGAKVMSFHKPPAFLPFSFAMIDDIHFGNGIGLNEHTIWLSLLHKHYFNMRIRHMVVTIQDVYIGGSRVTLPEFLRNAMNVGKTPEDFGDQPAPTFVIIGATDKALIARGNQSGGLAIWSRLPNDVRRVAYKDA